MALAQYPISFWDLGDVTPKGSGAGINQHTGNGSNEANKIDLETVYGTKMNRGSLLINGQDSFLMVETDAGTKLQLGPFPTSYELKPGIRYIWRTQNGPHPTQVVQEVFDLV